MNGFWLALLVLAAFAMGYIAMALLLFLRDTLAQGLGWVSQRSGESGLAQRAPDPGCPSGSADGRWIRRAGAVGLWVVGVAVGFAFSAGLGSSEPVSAKLDVSEAPSVMGFREGLAPACRGADWGYVDTGFDFVIPPQYTGVRRFSEGLGAVCEAQQWGYIDTRGRTVIPPQFMAAGDFREGRALVARPDGSLHLIGRDGLPRLQIKSAPARPDEETP